LEKLFHEIEHGALGKRRRQELVSLVARRRQKFFCLAPILQPYPILETGSRQEIDTKKVVFDQLNFILIKKILNSIIVLNQKMVLIDPANEHAAKLV